MGLVLALLAVTLFGSIAVFATKGAKNARNLALVISFAPLVASLWMLMAVPFGRSAITPEAFGFYETREWIPALGARLTFGVDGLAAPMVFLAALLTTLSILFHWTEETKAPQFFGLFLLLEFALIGVFTALDYLLFYVFWELVLIPMFFLIAVWGGINRKYAAIKFLLYTFLASLVMLLGIIALYFEAFPSGQRTFDVLAIATQSDQFGKTFQDVVFGALLVGFIVKMPMVPFHTWLPDAHVQAPTGGSAILAGVLLKMGAYGLLRMAWPTLPVGVDTWMPVLLALGITSMLWAGFVALAQRDLKSMIAYSSISHMGLVMLGFATLTPIGLVGGQFMMFAHGLISPALFMSAGVIHHATGTRNVDELGGIAKVMPRYATVTMFAFLASLGLPGLAGFVAEVLIFIGTWRAFDWLIILPALAVPLTAGYYLFAAKRAFYGPLNPRFGAVVEHHGATHHAPAGGSTEGGHGTEAVAAAIARHHGSGASGSAVSDIQWYEHAAMIFLTVGFILWGVWPNFGGLTDMMNEAATQVLRAMGAL